MSAHLVSSLDRFSRRIKISQYFAGTLILAIGTSVPELIDVSISSLLRFGSLGIGNVIGANIANICLILGIASVLNPVGRFGKKQTYDLAMVFITSVLFLLIILDGIISRVEGAVLVSVFFLYYFYMHKKEFKQEIEVMFKDIESDIILTPLAIAGILICGWIAVNTSAYIASESDISVTIFGLTVVALGTTTPELMSSIAASIKDKTKLAVGNLFGSNIINITLIPGIASLLNPISLQSVGVLKFSLFMLFGVTGIVSLLIRTDNKLTRNEGIIMIFMYMAYLIAVMISA